MPKTFVEILLFALIATNATLLIFIAGVLRQIMNDMNESEFTYFIGSLFNHSEKSPFMITILNIPAIIAIPYFYFYGFNNWWLTAGLALWFVAGIISKIYKLPIYKAIKELNRDKGVRFEEIRHKINMGNIFQAIFYSVSVVLMAFGLH
jgi:hypothetical protein